MPKIDFKISLALFLIAGAAMMRFLPHWPNFAPIAALALFSGTYLNKKYALVVPLAAMLTSDYFIGFYDWRLMSVVYGCLLISGLLGLFIRRRKSASAVIGAALFGSCIFFLVTNFAVWSLSSWYPHTWQGLTICYGLALPFFKNTLLGDLFYTGVLFGVYESIVFFIQEKKLVKQII